VVVFVILGVCVCMCDCVVFVFFLVFICHACPAAFYAKINLTYENHVKETHFTDVLYFDVHCSCITSVITPLVYNAQFTGHNSAFLCLKIRSPFCGYYMA